MARPLEDLVMVDPSFWFGRRVLLTGHTGFKGSWLLLWLQELALGVDICSEPEPTSILFTNLFHAVVPVWMAPSDWRSV